MKRFARFFVLFTVLATPAMSFALGEESFGNAPKAQQTGWAPGVLDVVNLKSRVYSQWVNGNENMFYKGDVIALNEALKAFAAITDDEHRVVLLPGSGRTQSFDQKPIAFDWQLHVPTGIYRKVSNKKHAVLTIYVPAMNPKPIQNRQQVDQWIQELDNDDFKIRDKAQAELEKLGRDVKPVFQNALKINITAEQRSRMTKILSAFNGFDSTDIVIPKGVTVAVANDLLSDCQKNLESKNQNVVWLASYEISNLATYCDDVVPNLINMLAVDKPENTRINAASNLGQLGKKAKSAVPALKTAQLDADAKIVTAMKAAIEQIESAKEPQNADEAEKTTKTILKELAQLKKSSQGHQ